MTRTAYDPSSPSLAEAFAPYFRVGAAINTWNLADESREDFRTLDRQFNIFTLENESKPIGIHPEEDRWNFERFDQFVEFGQKHGKSLRGHTLVWHGQVPDWFFFDENGELTSKERLLNRMRDHIATAVSRYKGKIAAWDVVNEVLRDDGGLRESRWYQISGDEYIKEAFRTAREADPAARLIINDYNLESSRPKAETMFNAVRNLLEEGVPVDGVGLQMHLGMDTDLEKLKQNVRMLAGLRAFKPDFKLEVTELDVTLYPYFWKPEDGEVAVTDELAAKFAEKYAELFRFYKELAREGILDSVVFWGLHDGVSWLNGFPKKHRNEPLLIGRDFLLKPAFDEVMKVAEEN